MICLGYTCSIPGFWGPQGVTKGKEGVQFTAALLTLFYRYIFTSVYQQTNICKFKQFNLLMKEHTLTFNHVKSLLSVWAESPVVIRVNLLVPVRELGMTCGPL